MTETEGSSSMLATRRNNYHLQFLQRSSPRLIEIIVRLSKIEEVRYRHVHFWQGSDIPDMFCLPFEFPGISILLKFYSSHLHCRITRSILNR